MEKLFWNHDLLPISTCPNMDMCASINGGDELRGTPNHLICWRQGNAGKQGSICTEKMPAAMLHQLINGQLNVAIYILQIYLPTINHGPIGINYQLLNPSKSRCFVVSKKKKKTRCLVLTQGRAKH